jgi:hypothetical protein
MAEIYQISINGTLVDGDDISCTGKQLALILDAVKLLLNSNEWYVVDVLVPGRYVIQPYNWIEKYEQVPLKIGSMCDLLNFAELVPQFQSGIIFGVSKDNKIHWNQSTFETESAGFIESAEVMIKAFDTTSFEVLSRRNDIISLLENRFVKE